MNIGERIKVERERLGFNQDEFAEKCGVSRRSQIMYEQNKTDAGAGYFTRISELGADVNYIFTGVRVTESLKNNAANDELNDETRWIISMFSKLTPEDRADATKEIKKIAEISELKMTVNHLMKNQAQQMRQAA